MPVDGYEETDFEYSGKRRKVFYRGEGPGILIMHELPGLTRECLDLGCRVADRNFKVFIPLLFGKPEFVKSRGRQLANAVSLLCVRREFNLWSENKHSPITDWLRALCRQIHTQCPGPGVGAIGMCLTGGLVISLMVDELLMAPVLSQPSLPFGFSAAKKEALGVPTEDLEAAKKRAADGLTLLGLRFKGDWICPPEKFVTLKRHFGEQFDGFELEGDAHSVLAAHFDDQEGSQTRVALDKVLTLFEKRLRP